VVENRLEELPSGAWSVDAEPLLAIGGLSAPESHQLFQISGATRLPDGRLAVASAGTHDVRVYSPEGELVGRFGRQGDGPEEFREPGVVGRYGADTLVVFDAMLSRVSWIHAEGGFLGSAPASWGGKGFPVAGRLLEDGSILVGGGMSFSSEAGFPTGVIRPESTFGWLRRNGEAVFLGDFPAAEMFARATEQGFMARGVPFARVTVAAPGRGGVWLGTGDDWTLQLLAPDGTARRVAHATGSLRPVTASERSAYVEEAVSETSTENEARQLRELLAEMPFPAHYPPYRSLVGDAAGNLWVEAYGGPGEEVPSWTVLDPLGRGVTRLTTPPRTRVLEIGRDYLLGRTLDDLGVESLTLWRLRRG
jgi:hypothetical protein